MHVLDEAFAEFGLQTCFMAEYFLPDINVLTAISCIYDTRIRFQEDFVDEMNQEDTE